VWLAAFLIAGLVFLGDLALQWPVLVVPLLWALVALRPRGRRSRDSPRGWEVRPAGRTDTVERAAVRDPGEGRGDA
jgi:hypothetical protein